MRPVGAVAVIPGYGIDGNPIAALVGSTSVRSPFGPFSRGHWLEGGKVPSISQ